MFAFSLKLFLILSVFGGLKADLDHDCFNKIQYICAANISRTNDSLIFSVISNETTTISFQESNVSVIPFKLFEKLETVSRIFMDFVKLERIMNGSFEGSGSLREFSARGNLIKELEDDTFLGASGLLKISLKSNLIKNVSEKTFNGLEKLQILDLSQNFIKQLEFLPILINLKSLSLNSNKIERISENTFANLTSLENIEMSFNLITNLNNNSFSGLSKNVTVDLFDNECIDARIALTNDSWRSFLKLCEEENQFSWNFQIDSCKNKFYKINDQCLNDINTRISQISSGNSTSSQNVADLKSQIEKLNQKVNSLLEKNNDLSKTLCKNLNSSTGFTNLYKVVQSQNETIENCKKNQTKFEELQKNFNTSEELIKQTKALNSELENQQTPKSTIILLSFLSFLTGIVLSVVLFVLKNRWNARHQSVRAYLLSSMMTDDDF